MNKYKQGFRAAVILNVILLALLAGSWWRMGATTRAPARMQASMTAASASMSDSTALSGKTEKAEPPLGPVQLSPQRLQSIGVRTGEVESKDVEDRIPTTGNVAVDETRLAYVQVRFSGYIQKVFVDATYQYVRKGQPLFTIYSPDLVSTEREYLLARQNQQQLAQAVQVGRISWPPIATNAPQALIRDVNPPAPLPASISQRAVRQ